MRCRVTDGNLALQPPFLRATFPCYSSKNSLFSRVGNFGCNPAIALRSNVSMARRTVRDTLFPVKLPVIGAALGRVEAPLAIPMDPALPEPFVVSPASVQYSA